MKNNFLILMLSIALSDYTLVEIDATSYSEWVYFSFTSGEIIEIEDPSSSNQWHLGIMRNHFRTNSGQSGNGIGGAYVDSSLIWNSEIWDGGGGPVRPFRDIGGMRGPILVHRNAVRILVPSVSHGVFACLEE